MQHPLQILQANSGLVSNHTASYWKVWLQPDTGATCTYIRACMHAYVACVHSFVCTYMELRLDLHRYIPAASVHARAHTDTNTKSHSLRENGCFGPVRTEPCTCGHPHLWSNISGTGTVVNECGFRSAKAGAICQACRVQCYTAEFGGTNLADIQILVTYW